MFAIASSFAVAVAPIRAEPPSVLTAANARGTITNIDARTGRVTVQVTGGEELHVVVAPTVAAQFDRGDEVDVATQLSLATPGADPGAVERSGSGPRGAETTGSGASGSGAPGSLHPPTEQDTGNPGAVQ